MVRESRGSLSRFAFFVACLAVGVAAIVSVAGLSDGLDRSIRVEARQLLAADLAVSGLSPLPAEAEQFIDSRDDLERLSIKEMVTVVATAGSGGVPGPSQVVELNVVGEGYPFYGELELDSQRPLAELLTENSVVAAPGLLARLGLVTGDELMVGGDSFTVAAAVLDEPDRVGGALTIGPRLFMSHAGLERAGLEAFGSRISHRSLIRLAGDADRAAVESLAEEIRELLPVTRFHRVETYLEAQPTLREGIRRAERFLGLAALLSLLIGGVGVSQTVRSWLAGRLDAVAILRCLGFRPGEVVLLYLGQAAVLGLVGSLLGALLGTLLLAAVPRLLAEFLPVIDVAIFQPAALLRGMALGMGVALLFALEPLLAVGKVPPMRVLRRDVEPAEPGRVRRLLTGAVVVFGVFAAAAVQSGSVKRGLVFTLGVGAAAAVLALLAWAGTKLIGRFPMRGAKPWFRNGVRALARPGAATLSAVTALGLGVLFVVGMGRVEQSLSGELAAQIPDDSPTAFLIDIQPDQWPLVRQILEGEGSTAVDSVPVVTARLAAIDEQTVEQLVEAEERRGARWALRREQRLTYARELPADNKVIEGALWGLDGVDEVSVEEDFARDLGVEVGAVLRFDIQGTEVDLTVSSIRTVDWQTFGINFFLVVEPGVLDDAPQIRLAAARLPIEREQRIQDLLAAGYPNVTLIRTREVLEKVGNVLGRVAQGVRLLGGFTVLAGIIILAGAVSSTVVRRGREIALLKTLGSTRGDVVRMFVVENALLGFVAGLVGTVGGSLLARGVVTRGFNLVYEWSPIYLSLAVVVTVLLTAITSVGAGWSALRRRPMEVLRSD
jgi:putative ABC transport system permease protein